MCQQQHVGTVLVHPRFYKTRKGYAHLRWHCVDHGCKTVNRHGSFALIGLFQHTLWTKHTVYHTTFFWHNGSYFKSGPGECVDFGFLLQQHTIVNVYGYGHVVFNEPVAPEIMFDIHIVHAEYSVTHHVGQVKITKFSKFCLEFWCVEMKLTCDFFHVTLNPPKILFIEYVVLTTFTIGFQEINLLYFVFTDQGIKCNGFHY